MKVLFLLLSFILGAILTEAIFICKKIKKKKTADKFHAKILLNFIYEHRTTDKYVGLWDFRYKFRQFDEFESAKRAIKHFDSDTKKMQSLDEVIRFLKRKTGEKQRKRTIQ